MTRVLLKSIDRGSLSRLPSVTIMPADPIRSCQTLRRRRQFAFHLPFALVALTLTLPLSLPALAQPGGMRRAQKHQSRHEIEQMEESWRNALLKSNTAAMDSLLSDDFIAINPNGDLQSKEQTLANLRSGATHFNSIETSDRRMRFYGTTALVTSRAEVSGTSPSGAFSGSFRYTRVYARDKQGNWKIVSFEASRIRQPGERKQAR